jgi:hypothetical protein
MKASPRRTERRELARLRAIRRERISREERLVPGRLASPRKHHYKTRSCYTLKAWDGAPCRLAKRFRQRRVLSRRRSDGHAEYLSCGQIGGQERDAPRATRERVRAERDTGSRLSASLASVRRSWIAYRRRLKRVRRRRCQATRRWPSTRRRSSCPRRACRSRRAARSGCRP